MMMTYTNKMTSSSKVLKLVSKLLFTMAVLMFTSNLAEAQRTVNVAPGAGTLNAAVAGDTTSTGDRVDPNTVYVLERDGFYGLDGSIENRGYHLTIVAEDGTGARPFLLPLAGDGGTSSRPFRARGDLTLRGLYITGEDNSGNLNQDQRIIRISENDVRIVIDDCHLDKDSQAGFRVDNSGNRIYIMNSIVSNIGTTASPDNGRAIDDRGSQIDTLVIENSTFYNLTSQVLRDAGGEINYVRVNHNTAVNVGKNGAFEFGQVLDATFTNNLVINGAFFGRPESEQENETLTVVSIDSLSPTQVDSLGEASILIRNNNIYRDEALTNAYPDSVVSAADFNADAMAYIEEDGTASTNISEAIEFTSGPAVPVDVVTSFYLTPDADQPDMPTDGEPFDFAYASSYTSFTASSDGDPIGALSWHGLVVSNEDEGMVNTPRSFELHGNYPNPFNPTTNISFNLSQAAQVSVEVFSVIGQKVLTVPTQQMSAGSNQTVMIDATNLTSGMYIYRVTAHTSSNTMVNSGRMTLIK